MNIDTETFYYCDPAKNTACNKENCLYESGDGECYACHNPAFARDGLPSFRFVPNKASVAILWERVT